MSEERIPVFGTQVLNSFSNFKKLLHSIDFNIDCFSVVINNKNINLFHDIKEEIEKNKYIKKSSISFHPTNLGCAASWNYHFKTQPHAEYYIKSDDDIQLSPNDLKTIVENLKNNDVVFYSPGTKYALFGIKRTVLQEVGLFDENLYPANFEDDDYQRRLSIKNIKTKILNLNTIHNSSATSRNFKKNEHSEKMVPYLNTTTEYFERKWKSEFGDPLLWNYNFNYRKDKSLECDYYQ